MTKISLNVSVADSRITSFHLSENRLKRIMSGDKEQALYMGFWDRTAEFFRSEKKADVLAQLWTMMYPTDNSSAPVSKLDKFKVQMDAFQSLVSMVDEEAVKKLNNNVNPFSFTANSDVNTDNINFTFFLKGEPFKVITLNRNDFDGEVSGLNFRGGKFEDLDFSGMDFKDIDFTECIFSRVNVSNCKFTNCPISRVKFLDSTGKGASFQYGIETSADIGVIEKSMPQYICRDADFSTLSGPVTFHKTIFLNSEVLDIK
ncbi:Salmonella outer protein D 2 [Escherichia coli]|uniref:pentapeptide repeat-containing protein n=1 Tax=Escherichia coli TaxID=562 RepID=UPI000DA5DF2C|nr:pentapeptide repeat-containing protein [Escherichia coli]SQM12178.1 Salmonella outer protein D 2 [Escherichia coli]SQM26765.1 Salmonella outer protein D 2 [Escherichia coli]